MFPTLSHDLLRDEFGNGGGEDQGVLPGNLSRDSPEESRRTLGLGRHRRRLGCDPDRVSVAPVFQNSGATAHHM